MYSDLQLEVKIISLLLGSSGLNSLFTSTSKSLTSRRVLQLVLDLQSAVNLLKIFVKLLSATSFLATVWYEKLLDLQSGLTLIVGKWLRKL